MDLKTGAAPSERIASIDALRGFDMFWIMGADFLFRKLFTLSDNPFFVKIGDQFEHSAWNGFTFEDLIFPLFLFIVGVVMPFSLTKRLDRGESRNLLYRHIIVRTLVLLAFGLVFNGFLDFRFGAMRYAGVLQRIALCYFFAALIVMNTRVRGQAIWAAGILVFYWAVMMLVPVPGYGAGVLTPEGNLASFIDQHLLPGRFCCFQYGDNEGILSTIPAIATTLLGVLTGHWLRSSAPASQKVSYIFGAGALCLAAGSVWNAFFPVNKLIWTSSYVLFAGGWSLLLLGLFYWVIDIRGYGKWAFPLVIIGLNPITIYMAQRFFDFESVANIFVHAFTGSMGDFQPVFMTVCVLFVKWLFLYFLFRQKIFLKV
ncbi:DUF5009 domain-containing protein [bacterium]|nr:DUF5009 domain-containing protein [bacterium]